MRNGPQCVPALRIAIPILIAPTSYLGVLDRLACYYKRNSLAERQAHRYTVSTTILAPNAGT